MATPTRPRRRLLSQVQQIEAQPHQQSASDVFFSASTAQVMAGVFGRMGRGQPSVRPNPGAPPTALAYGNSVVTVDTRGADTAQPGKGKGNGQLADLSPFNAGIYGDVRGRQIRRVDTPPEALSAAYTRTDAFQHGRLIAHDRHIIENQGRVTSSANNQRTGANPNPEADGPARPAWKMFNRTLSHQIGVDSTANLDNGQFHAALLTTDGRRKFPLATQGDEWSKVYGGTPGLANHRPYGKRGGFDQGAPRPTVRADPGGPYRFNTLLQVGDPADGPQKVYGGLPWGLHSPTLPSRQHTKAVIESRLGQVKPVQQNRPQNSKAAGQAWSQSVVSLSGQQAVKLAATPPIRQPGMNSRWLGA